MFEYCYTPINPAISQARKLRRDYAEEIAKKDNDVIDKKNYARCHKCVYKGNYTYYPKIDLKEIKYATIRDGKEVIQKYYICEKCSK